MPDILLRVNDRNTAAGSPRASCAVFARSPGSFSLTVSEKWSGQASAWPILPEDECEISIEAPPPFRDGSR
jgi:hypothetical protein